MKRVYFRVAIYVAKKIQPYMIQPASSAIAWGFLLSYVTGTVFA